MRKSLTVKSARRLAGFVLLLLAGPVAAQQPTPIPMDTVVARTLAEAWPPHYQRRDALACFYGRRADGGIDVDSVRVILTLECRGREVVGVAGFLDGSGYARGQVVSGLCDAAPPRRVRVHWAGARRGSRRRANEAPDVGLLASREHRARVRGFDVSCEENQTPSSEAVLHANLQPPRVANQSTRLAEIRVGPGAEGEAAVVLIVEGVE